MWTRTEKTKPASFPPHSPSSHQSQDLNEVFRLATRSGMALILADYHLKMGNLDEAERLIKETGYHRRDAELAALRAKLNR